MPQIHCLSIIDVGILIGYEPDVIPARICLPFMNVGIYIGGETPDIHPPEFLRHSITGDVLLNEDGTPLLVS